jgi:uncharacterized protein (DUF983 family)
MHVTRRQIITRGLSGDCPNCGGHTLFKPGARFSINEQCAHCGLKFERGDGFFLGPFVINYTVTVVIFIIPIILLSAFGKLGPMAAIVTAGAGALVIPILLYRQSWSWWLMAYFYFLPQKLPNNRDESHEDEEE